ncbi:MAG: 50S ribosomal protein L4 [Candidatus Omnitrophica bacterium]|jgi:large subunit ribosomal protein L4|nr:50S ribosomal protein L4 [Candidatus Omnitrophota bacterium]
MNISVLNIKGKEVGKLELDSSVFDGKVRNSLMHQAVVAHLANQRQGLASTKTRGEVSGGGRKPWRQKGTGRARVGSTRSPLWRKGGITFGPKPHSFRKDLPNRMKILALKSALNSKLHDNEMIVLDGLKIDSPKTKEFFEIVKTLKINDLRIRFVVGNLDKNLKLSCRNLPNVEIDSAASLNTYCTLDCKKLIFTKDALEVVETRVKKWLK